MDFYFAGGAMEVGGSCIYVRTGDKGILMDSGIRQGGASEKLPDLRGIQERGGVDLILVSHAHMDHTGSLPVISKAYPGARIYMTSMAMDQTRVLLYDSLKLMDRKEEEIPQYSREDVEAMLKRIVPIHYQQEISLPELDMKLTAYPAGHIAGAACLYLQTPEGSIFYSGDVSGFAQQTIEGIGIPRLRPDVVLLESTYGDRLHASRTLEENRLVQTVAQCAEKGMKVLIPAFALGRSQEVLLILKKAMQNKAIPAIPVYVDGMVRDMNRVYKTNPTFLKRNLARRIMKGDEPFYTEWIREVGTGEDRNALTEMPGPAVFVASSGMLSGGPSIMYAKKLLPREDACVVLTGYQDEESPGRLLLNLLDGDKDREGETERRVTLDGTSVPVKAEIVMVGLSAHADQSDLCGIVERVSGRRVILVHGSAGAISALGEQLSSDVRRQIWQPSDGETVSIQMRGKRQQISDLQDHMNCRVFEGEGVDPLRLWDFVRTRYRGRGLTIRQLMYLWFGREDALSEEELQKFQEDLLASGFFDRHPKRLYLFLPREEEDLRALKEKGEPTVQDVEAGVRSLLDGRIACPVRKIGYYTGEKKAVLTVDFPDALDPGLISDISEKLSEELGWTLELKGNMNNARAEMLLNGLFPGRCGRISYYPERKTCQISLLKKEEGDREKALSFEKTTGWKLEIPGEESPKAPLSQAASIPLPGESPRWFYPAEGAERAEQNLAFSLVDQFFEESPVKPGKKGRKNDQNGVYLELSFISPELGERCATILEEVALRTGWRVHISESVNQAQLTVIAAGLCSSYGVLQEKIAYLPAFRAVRIKNAPQTPVPDQMREEFLKHTGLPLID